MFLILFFGAGRVWGQTTLIDPTGDGGFENGSTFSANGWTEVNGSDSQWAVGNLASHSGSRGGYIQYNSSYSYRRNKARTVHFYKDVTVPSGNTDITLSFYWKGSGEIGYDRLLVYTAPTSVIPSAGSPSSNSTNLTGATLIYTQTSFQINYTFETISLPSTLAGTTFRLIFTWQNNNNTGTQPPAAIDNISLTSQALGPTLSISPATLDFGDVCLGSSSTAQTFVLTGTNLTGGITISQPSGYTVSPTSISAANANGDNTITVQFNPTSEQTYSEIITITSTGASDATVNLSGVGINTSPSISSPTSTNSTATTADLGGNITDLGCSTVTEWGIYWSITDGFADGAGTKVSFTGTGSTGSFTVPVAGLSASTVYYFKAFATNGGGTAYSTQGTFTTSCASPGPVTLPWTEGFESVEPTLGFTSNTSQINGLCIWDYEKDNIGRLQFDYPHNGSYAANLDADGNNNSVNYLIVNLDLSNYSSSTDLELSFWHINYGDEDNSNDRVWIRGSNSDSWIEIYDLTNLTSVETWTQVTALDIDAAISAAGQTVTSTFQIRFGQEDNYSLNLGTTASDGRGFDDILIAGSLPCFTAPTATCQDIIVNLDASGNANITGSQIDNGSTSPCGNSLSFSVSPNSFSCSDLGNNTVTLTVTDDGNSQTATCSATVTVQDVTDPTFSNCPADVNVQITSGNSGIANWTAPTANDNCNVASTISTHNPGETFNLGTTTVTYTATDDSGNTGTCSFNVVVAYPTANCGSNLLTNGGFNIPTPASWQIYNSSQVPGWSATPDEIEIWISGGGGGQTSYEGGGLSELNANGPTTIYQDVSTTPGITMQWQVVHQSRSGGDETIEVRFGSPGSTILEQSITSNGTGWNVYTGEYTIPAGQTTTRFEIASISPTGSSGNLIDDIQFFPLDRDGPIVETTTSDIQNVPIDAGQCSAVVNYTAPTFYDYCDGSALSGTLIAGLASGSAFPIGTTTVTYEYTDTGGNGTVTSSFTVEVVEDENPAIPTLADVTGECSATATAPTTTDNCAGTITGTTSDALTYTTEGTHVITWNFDDGNGNDIDVTQNVVIDDNTAPVPDNASLSDITAECSVTTLTAPTATDNCVGSVTGTTTTTLPITTQGTTVVTWTYDDGNGNTSTQTQNVVIDDVSNPTITCPSDINQSVDAGLCTASGILLGTPTTGDNCSVASVTNDAPVTFPVGTTVVTWTVTDIAGNTATCPQNVVIVPEEDIDISVVALVDFCQSGQAGTTTVTWSVQLLAGTTDWTYDYTINDGSTDVASDTSVSATGNITISYTMNNGGNDKTFTLTITNVKDDCGISETGTTIHSEEVTVTAVPTTGEIIPD